MDHVATRLWFSDIAFSQNDKQSGDLTFYRIIQLCLGIHFHKLSGSREELTCYCIILSLGLAEPAELDFEQLGETHNLSNHSATGHILYIHANDLERSE
jgi:hypothetical protein